MINIDFKTLMKWSIGTGAGIGAIAGGFMLPSMLLKDLLGKHIGPEPKNDNIIIEAIIWSSIGACAFAITSAVGFAAVKSINCCITNAKQYLSFTESMVATINNEEANNEQEPLIANSRDNLSLS